MHSKVRIKDAAQSILQIEFLDMMLVFHDDMSEKETKNNILMGVE